MSAVSPVLDPHPDVRVALAHVSILGESPMWHPREGVLYWCDIPGHALHRLNPSSGDLAHWSFETDVSAVAPRLDGTLLLAMRDGLWRFDPASGQRSRLAEPPYDTAHERFNDGKCDAQGRFWVGTIFEPRDPANAALYCYDGGKLAKRADGITVSNGLAWSPDGATMYWSDTKAHTVYAFDFEAATGALHHRRVFARFEPKPADGSLTHYRGRPDGAAMDAEGCYWAAMFEGQRVLRIAPTGEVLREVILPARCPTMPTFGGPDLKTLYITTARENRPAAELAMQPFAGCLLALDVDVPGLPANLYG